MDISTAPIQADINRVGHEQTYNNFLLAYTIAQIRFAIKNEQLITYAEIFEDFNRAFEIPEREQLTNAQNRSRLKTMLNKV
jgi:hypothetical protein